MSQHLDLGLELAVQVRLVTCMISLAFQVSTQHISARLQGFYFLAQVLVPCLQGFALLFKLCLLCRIFKYLLGSSHAPFYFFYFWFVSPLNPINIRDRFSSGTEYR